MLILSSSCLTTRASQPTRTVAADPATPSGPEVDELKQEITYLTGRIEELERAQKQGTTKPDELKSLRDRLDRMEQNQTALQETITKLQSQVPPPDPETVFSKGKDEFESGNFSESLAHFSSYIRLKERNPKAALKNLEEATWLKAESQFQLRNFKQAILDYNSIIEKFRKSKYHPKALLKTAQAFEALGMKDDAQAFYKELLDRHPKSPEARSLSTKAPRKSKKSSASG
jgi:TolA-binding protein